MVASGPSGWGLGYAFVPTFRSAGECSRTGTSRRQDIHSPGMPPPDLSHHESLALSQAKALARAGIDPNEASTASAFLEDELGGFYHRLGQGGQEKQQSKRDAEMQLDAAHAFDNSSSSADAEDGGEGGETAQRRRQEEEEESG